MGVKRKHIIDDRAKDLMNSEKGTAFHLIFCRKQLCRDLNVWNWIGYFCPIVRFPIKSSYNSERRLLQVILFDFSDHAPSECRALRAKSASLAFPRRAGSP